MENNDDVVKALEKKYKRINKRLEDILRGKDELCKDKQNQICSLYDQTSNLEQKIRYLKNENVELNMQIRRMKQRQQYCSQTWQQEQPVVTPVSSNNNNYNRPIGELSVPSERIRNNNKGLSSTVVECDENECYYNLSLRNGNNVCVNHSQCRQCRQNGQSAQNGQISVAKLEQMEQNEQNEEITPTTPAIMKMFCNLNMNETDERKFEQFERYEENESNNMNNIHNNINNNNNICKYDSLEEQKAETLERSEIDTSSPDSCDCALCRKKRRERARLSVHARNIRNDDGNIAMESVHSSTVVRDAGAIDNKENIEESLQDSVNREMNDENDENAENNEIDDSSLIFISNNDMTDEERKINDKFGWNVYLCRIWKNQKKIEKVYKKEMKKLKKKLKKQKIHYNKKIETETQKAYNKGKKFAAETCNTKFIQQMNDEKKEIHKQIEQWQTTSQDAWMTMQRLVSTYGTAMAKICGDATDVDVVPLQLEQDGRDRMNKLNKEKIIEVIWSHLRGVKSLAYQFIAEKHETLLQLSKMLQHKDENENDSENRNKNENENENENKVEENERFERMRDEYEQRIALTLRKIELEMKETQVLLNNVPKLVELNERKFKQKLEKIFVSKCEKVGRKGGSRTAVINDRKRRSNSVPTLALNRNELEIEKDNENENKTDKERDMKSREERILNDVCMPQFKDANDMSEMEMLGSEFAAIRNSLRVKDEMFEKTENTKNNSNNIICKDANNVINGSGIKLTTPDYEIIEATVNEHDWQKEFTRPPKSPSKVKNKKFNNITNENNGNNIDIVENSKRKEEKKEIQEKQGPRELRTESRGGIKSSKWQESQELRALKLAQERNKMNDLNDMNDNARNSDEFVESVDSNEIASKEEFENIRNKDTESGMTSMADTSGLGGMSGLRDMRGNRINEHHRKRSSVSSMYSNDYDIGSIEDISPKSDEMTDVSMVATVGSAQDRMDTIDSLDIKDTKGIKDTSNKKDMRDMRDRRECGSRFSLTSMESPFEEKMIISNNMNTSMDSGVLDVINSACASATDEDTESDVCNNELEIVRPSPLRRHIAMSNLFRNQRDEVNETNETNKVKETKLEEMKRKKRKLSKTRTSVSILDTNQYESIESGDDLQAKKQLKSDKSKYTVTVTNTNTKNSLKNIKNIKDGRDRSIALTVGKHDKQEQKEKRERKKGKNRVKRPQTARAVTTTKTTNSSKSIKSRKKQLEAVRSRETEKEQAKQKKKIKKLHKIELKRSKTPEYDILNRKSKVLSSKSKKAVKGVKKPNRMNISLSIRTDFGIPSNWSDDENSKSKYINRISEQKSVALVTSPLLKETKEMLLNKRVKNAKNKSKNIKSIKDKSGKKSTMKKKKKKNIKNNSMNNAVSNDTDCEEKTVSIDILSDASDKNGKNSNNSNNGKNIGVSNGSGSDSDRSHTSRDSSESSGSTGDGDIYYYFDDDSTPVSLNSVTPDRQDTLTSRVEIDGNASKRMKDCKDRRERSDRSDKMASETAIGTVTNDSVGEVPEENKRSARKRGVKKDVTEVSVVNAMGDMTDIRYKLFDGNKKNDISNFCNKYGYNSNGSDGGSSSKTVIENGDCGYSSDCGDSNKENNDNNSNLLLID